MSLIEFMIASLISSSIVLGMGQSTRYLFQTLEKQQSMSLLQAEGLQALQVMGEAIRSAHLSKDSRGFRLMAHDSASLSNSKAAEFQVRKGASSLDGSDAFYTQQGSNAANEKSYQAFFVQWQGHHEYREGVLYLQTKNKKGGLQNDALIGHVQSLQVQVGILESHAIQWLEPYQLQERASKRHPHWKQVRAIKINLKLQKDQHQLELKQIITIRQT